MGQTRIYRTGLRILFGGIFIVFITAPLLSAQKLHPRIAVLTPGLGLAARGESGCDNFFID
jgi:hypothetical protein